jgi:hypothetical protein
MPGPQSWGGLDTSTVFASNEIDVSPCHFTVQTLDDLFRRGAGGARALTKFRYFDLQ